MASAQQISQYEGNSEFAGGVGATGTQQAIQSTWKMTDSINQSIAMLQAQEFKRNQDLYQQRIKDRDALGKMITDGSFVTDKMEDSKRLEISSRVGDFKNKFVELAKKGTISDADFLEVTNDYANVKREAEIAKLNYLTIEADEKLNNEMYDPNGSTKTSTSVKERDESGNVTKSESHTVKDENVRRSSENQKRWEKHMAAEKEKAAKDPFYMVKPFVPVSRINYEVAFPEIGVDVTETPVGKDGFKVEVKTTPSFKKTADTYAESWADPDKRQDIQRAYDQIVEGMVQGNVASVTAITDANKKIMEINAAGNAKEGQGLPLITKDTNVPLTMALINFTRGYDKVPKTSQKYVDASAAKMAEKKFNTDEEIRQSRATNAIERAENLQEYKGKKIIDKEFPDAKQNDDLIKEVYKSRSEAINTDRKMTGAQKQEALKKLEEELKIGSFDFKGKDEGETKAILSAFVGYLIPTENKGGKLDQKNLAGSSALGNYQMIDSTRHEMMNKVAGYTLDQKELAAADNKFKKDAKYQEELAFEYAGELNSKIPENIQGEQRVYMLAKGWYTGNVNYPDNKVPGKPGQNKMTAKQYAESVVATWKKENGLDQAPASETGKNKKGNTITSKKGNTYNLD